MKRFGLTMLILLILALAGLEVVTSKLAVVRAADVGGASAPVMTRPLR